MDMQMDKALYDVNFRDSRYIEPASSFNTRKEFRVDPTISAS